MTRYKLLNAQADRIEAVLASHRVEGRVWGGQVTPRFIRFQVTTGLGTRITKVTQLSEEIALSLGVGEARVYRQNGAIQVEVPLEKAGVVRLLGLTRRLEGVPGATAVLGVEEEGVPLLLRLTSPEVVHVLVAGTTGSGKTALVRSMLASMAMYSRQGEVQMVLIDPKGRGFGPLEGLPHVVGRVVREVGEGGEALGWLVKQMEWRDREGIREPAIVVAVDEMADLISVGGSGVEGSLLRLAQRGREAGIHVIGCTQKPSASAVSTVLKASFPVRVVGSVASPEDAKVAAGIGGSGAEKLMGRGDFLLVNKGTMVRFQAAYASEEELQGIVRGLRGGREQG